MNIPNLIKTRDTIMSHTSQFNYCEYAGAWAYEDVDPFECGTIGCVAGFAVVALRRKRRSAGQHALDVDNVGMLGLELTAEEEQFLFFPSLGKGLRSILSDFDHTDAIDRLNWLIDGQDIEQYVVPPRKARTE